MKRRGRTPFLKGTCRLQSTLVLYLTHTTSFLGTSSVHRRRRPTPRDLRQALTQGGPAPGLFRDPEPAAARGPSAPARRARHSPAANRRRAARFPGVAAPPPAGTRPSEARRPPPLLAQARQGLGRGADAAGEDGAGERGPHREGAAPRVS